MNTNRPLGSMLVSKAKDRVIEIDVDKVSRGSFYTTQNGWLTPQVVQFLAKALAESNGQLLDPFAGDGHLLQAVSSHELLSQRVAQSSGFDIEGQTWPINDSLIAIPNPTKAVILTNPPYLANHSARRKGVLSLVQKYFEVSGENNLYRIAIKNSLAVSDYVVAIIPETFLLSSFPKDRLELVVVIQDELFGDTEAPAVVACFGKVSNQDALVYKSDRLVGKLSEVLALRTPYAKTKVKIVFNEPNGRIGLRAVDGSDGKSPIEFLAAKDFSYPKSDVLVSSRLMTYLEIPLLEEIQVVEVIDSANTILKDLRVRSADLVLAPFKGNDRNGKRRRRLDYALARRILNEAVSNLKN